MRLDAALIGRGLITGREKAKAVIMAGLVYVNNQKESKAGLFVKAEDNIEVRGEALPYVSRGGLKLEKALNVFNIDLNDEIAIDIGASTGGFTDCMLQNGTKKVYCVDVGYGQLAWKLRTDARVINFERTNIRYVTEEQIPEKLDFATVDVSFISLKLVLPVVFNLLKENGEAVCLIKPQFEAGRDKVGKKGVVRDIEIHKEVLYNIIQYAKNANFYLKGLDFSPIKGPEGNIEYLLYISKSSGISIVPNVDLITEQSYKALKEGTKTETDSINTQ